MDYVGGIKPVGRVPDQSVADTVRPPGSQPEAVFLERCDQCGDCVHICPETMLIIGADGYPEVDLSQGVCGGCGLCGDVCTRAAISEIAADARAERPSAAVDRDAMRALIRAATARIAARG